MMRPLIHNHSLAITLLPSLCRLGNLSQIPQCQLPFTQKRFKTHSARRLRLFKRETDEHPWVQKLLQTNAAEDWEKRVVPSGREDGVSVIDCFYRNMPHTAAAFLVKEGNEAAFIDNNTLHSVPALMQALKMNGLTPEQVKWIIITHIHLDHAGSTAELVRLCPNAKVLCHPRAVRHLNDPTRLLKGVRRVYGYQLIEQLFKAEEIGSVPFDRIQTVASGDRLIFGKREFEFTHVLGHARHHILIHDLTHKSIFTGDSFGISYQPFIDMFVKTPSLHRDSFLFPTTAPSDFDANEEWKVLDQIEHGVKKGTIDCAYLTHFGLWSDMPRGLKQLRMGYLLHSNLTLHIRERIQTAVFYGAEAESFGRVAIDRMKIGKTLVSRRDGSELPIDEYYEEIYLEEVMDELRRFWLSQLEHVGVDIEDRLLRLHLAWDCALNGSGIVNAAIRDVLILPETD